MDDASWHGLYRILAGAAKMPKPTVPYEHPSGGRAAIAWPQLHIALALEGDDTKLMEKEDWTVFVLANQTLTALAAFLKTVNDLSYERLLRESERGLSNKVSTQERVMLAALLEKGLPMPVRDMQFVAEGRTITVPDFAWPDAKIVLEVDGLFHHGGRELREEILAAAGADPDKAALLKKRSETRQTKDAAKRRALSAEGWQVLVATDSEIDKGEAARIAQQVKEAYDRRVAEQGIEARPPVPADQRDRVMEDAVAAAEQLREEHGASSPTPVEQRPQPQQLPLGDVYGDPDAIPAPEPVRRPQPTGQEDAEFAGLPADHYEEPDPDDLDDLELDEVDDDEFGGSGVSPAAGGWDDEPEKEHPDEAPPWADAPDDEPPPWAQAAPSETPPWAQGIETPPWAQ